MTTLKTNAIEPEGGTTNLTIGLSGQNVVIGGSGGLKANTFKDAGGNTLWTSDGSGNLSSVGGFGGAQVLISSQTASNSASLAFTSGLTSTYKEYIFEFFNINPASQDPYFTFQVNASGQSGYNETITSTMFYARHSESNATADMQYGGDADQAQGTAYQAISRNVNNASDECLAGTLQLLNPSNTTYVKTWYSVTTSIQDTPLYTNTFCTGYVNVTAAITNIDFKMSSGNFDGTIKMYGIK